MHAPLNSKSKSMRKINKITIQLIISTIKNRNRIIIYIYVVRISEYNCEVQHDKQTLSSQTSLNTGCPRRNVQYFGRVFLMLNYTDITQNTYIQS